MMPLLLLFLVATLTFSLPAVAQDASIVTPALEQSLPTDPAISPAPVPDAVVPDASISPPAVPNLQGATDPLLIVEDLQGNEIDVSKIDSLFFSKWEHDLLIDARRGLVTRPVVPGDMGGEVPSLPESQTIGPREVALSGIAYVSSKDWTIWLNGMRITPTAIPSMIMDLKVYKDRIELDWLDQGANKIYPIRLRPYQKFNLDTRMFLPSGE